MADFALVSPEWVPGVERMLDRDYEGVVEFYRAHGAAELFKSGLPVVEPVGGMMRTRLLDPNFHVTLFVRGEDGSIEAALEVCSMFEMRRKVGYIENVLVRPDCRGRGHLDKLWAAALHHARHFYHSELRLHVDPDNRPAWHTYVEKWGMAVQAHDQYCRFKILTY